MITAEQIVALVKLRDSHTGNTPRQPEPWHAYDHPTSNVSESIHYTLEWLGAGYEPFKGAQLVPRSIREPSRKHPSVVDTAIWPIFRLTNPLHATGEIEFVMDAYGDLMARAISHYPDMVERPSWVRALNPAGLSQPFRNKILMELESIRGEVEASLYASEPSFI